MCKIPKVLLVAPADRLQELRRVLSSIEYDIVTSEDIAADVAIAWEPSAEDVSALRARDLKVVAVGANAAGADMHLQPDDIKQFKTRIWELFRPT